MTGADLVGQTLGNYRIDALMGTGGMGRVYRGLHVLLNRPVAIKVMHDNLAADPGFRARFLQEAKAAANLNHPNIIQVYDFGEESGRFFLVMELLNDGSMRTLLRQANGRPLSLPLATNLVEQVASGLDYAHRQGMVHRDIKPDNLLLSHRDGSGGAGPTYGVKITDFGLAQLTEGDIVTATGLTMGTPAYMSPEQAIGESLDGRSDLYSLGVVLYEVVAGLPPFQVNSLSAAVYKHVNVLPNPPHELNPEIPDDLEQVVLRCLAKRREERFHDCAELASALARVERQLDSGHHDTGCDNEGQPPVTVVEANVDTPTTVVQASDDTPTTEVLPSPGPRDRTEIVKSPTAEFAMTKQGVAPSDDFPPSVIPVSTSGLPRILVVEDGKVINQASLGTRGLHAGRSPENDIVLADGSISRQHLKIDWSGDRAIVMDLGSGNGTFIGDRRLPVNIPQIWNPFEQVHLGPYWLQLQTPVSIQSYVADLAVQNPELTPRTPVEDRSAVGLTLDRDELTIVPGQRQTLTATVANLGRLVAHADLSVEGVPGPWVILPTTTQLLPGAQASLAMTVDVPRSPTSRSGEYPVTINVVATREGPGTSASQKDVASAAALWTVEPFADSSLTLQPQRRSGRTRSRYNAVLTNGGNAETTYALTGHDEEVALGFEFKQPEVTLDPGQEQAVEVGVYGMRRWMGRPQSRRFTIRSSTRSESQPKSVMAEFIQLAMIPTWLPVVALLVAGALAVIIPRLLHVDAPVIQDPSYDPAAVIHPGQPETVTWQISHVTSLNVPEFNKHLDLSKKNRTFDASGAWTVSDGSSNDTPVKIFASSVSGLTGAGSSVSVSLSIAPGVLMGPRTFKLVAFNGKKSASKVQTIDVEGAAQDSTATASATAAGTGAGSGSAPSLAWNFANATGDWFIGQKSGVSTSITNGIYSIVVDQGNHNGVIQPASATDATDQRIIADATLRQGSLGLVVRYSTSGTDKAQTFYDCSIDIEDQYACGAMIQGKYSWIVQPSRSSAIKHGQENHLDLSVTGDTISFAINGTTVSERRDPQITHGGIALEVNSTADGEGSGAFSRVQAILGH